MAPKNLRPHHPHDRFIRTWFGDPEAMRELMQARVPKELLVVCNLDEMELQQGTFIDTELRATASDLLWKVGLKEKGNGYFYVLMEHQRKEDPLMAFRVLCYMCSIWKQDIKSREGQVNKLPFIFPIVLYQDDKEWKAPTQFQDLVEIPENGLKRYVPRWDFDLQNVMEMDPDKRDGLLFYLGIKSLQVAVTKELKQWGHEVTEALEMLLQLVEGSDRFQQVMVYVLAAVDSGDGKEILKQALNPSKQTQSKLMSILEQIKLEGQQEGIEKGIEKGIARGIEKGIVKNQIEMVRNLHREGFEIEIIARVTGLPESRVTEILQDTADQSQ